MYYISIMSFNVTKYLNVKYSKWHISISTEKKSRYSNEMEYIHIQYSFLEIPQDFCAFASFVRRNTHKLKISVHSYIERHRYNTHTHTQSTINSLNPPLRCRICTCFWHSRTAWCIWICQALTVPSTLWVWQHVSSFWICYYQTRFLLTMIYVIAPGTRDNNLSLISYWYFCQI